MTVSIVGLALAYVLLILLTLLAVLKSEIGAGLKLLLVVLCCGFYLWHYDALQRYPGWPADEDLPRRFELVSSFSVEPDPKNDEAGGVYLWVRDLDAASALPRAYRLPYRRTLHRKVADVQRRQQEGERFVASPAAQATGKPASIQFEAVQRDTGPHKSSLQ